MKNTLLSAGFFRRNKFKKEFRREADVVTFKLLQLGRSENNPPILYSITVHVVGRETPKGRVTGYLLHCVKSEYNNTPFRVFDGWISTIEDFQDVMRVVGIKRKFKYDEANT